MSKYLPYVFPFIVTTVVILLTLRWYKLRSSMDYTPEDYVPRSERNCSEFGDFTLNNVPARCYQYFKGEN